MNSVGIKSRFKRSYLIFTNEDAGYEAGQKPSGHVKVEIREGRGKLHAVAQNLRPGNGRFYYALYLLPGEGNSAEPVRAGLLENKLNKWELEWTFDPTKLRMSGYPADDGDVIAILVEFADRQEGGVICPLAAYRNKPVEWRSSFRQTEPSTETLSVGNLNEPKAGNRTEEDAAAKKENGCEKRKNDSVGRHVDGAPPEAGNGNDGINVAATEMKTEGEDSNNDTIDAEIGNEGRDSPENAVEIEAEIGAESEAEAAGESERDAVSYDAMAHEALAEEDVGAGKTIHESQTHESTNTIDTTCIYLNGNMCGALIQAEAGEANPCGTCQIRCGGQPSNVRLPVDMAQLKITLDSNFEQSDPFHSNRSDYVWWKVTNPVNLNNILYLNGIRSPLLFNPAVMIAHYKYRHFIIGIFMHMDGRKYVVCGVPGMHMVDRKPFGELGTWVQTEGKRLRYGAFGYWLVYISPEDGKMLNLNQNAES